MKEALAWAIGLTGAAAVTATAAYALTGGGQSATPPAQAKATPPPQQTSSTPSTPSTPTTTATPNEPVVGLQPKPTPAPTPVSTPTPSTPPVTTPAGGHTVPLPAKQNTTSITVAPGTITAPQVGIAGSVLIIYVNEQGSVANQWQPGALPSVDGSSTIAATVADTAPLTPSVGTALYTQSGDAVAVQTTRDDGTIIVSWLDGNGNVQQTNINYGTPPEYPTMMTVPVPVQAATPSVPSSPGAPASPNVQTGAATSIAGVGLSGSKVIITPPSADMTILSPVVIDGQKVNLESVAPGKQQTILTPNWSGSIHVYWTTSNLPPSAPGAAPIDILEPQPPGQQISYQMSAIYYGA